MYGYSAPIKATKSKAPKPRPKTRPKPSVKRKK